MTASRTYWLIVIALFGVSAFFAVQVERFRSGLEQGSGTLCLAVGDEAVVQSALDGDEVLVRREGCIAVVRILGIRSFDPLKAEYPLNMFGQKAWVHLKSLEGRVLKVLGPKVELDARDRTLATLEHEGADLGLDMVRQGLVLVYRRYDFDRLEDYLEAEHAAMTSHAGLWVDDAAVARAKALQSAWERERQR